MIQVIFFFHFILKRYLIFLIPYIYNSYSTTAVFLERPIYYFSIDFQRHIFACWKMLTLILILLSVGIIMLFLLQWVENLLVSVLMYHWI